MELTIYIRLFPNGKLPSGDNKAAAIIRFREALWVQSNENKRTRRTVDLTPTLRTQQDSEGTPDEVNGSPPGSESAPAAIALALEADSDMPPTWYPRTG